MPFVNPDSTFGLQADRVNTLYQRIADIRDRYPSFIDARRVNLNNVMVAANASIAILRLLDWVARAGEDVLIHELRLAKPEYIKPVAEDLLRASRLFLLLESQFQVEALFRNLLRALGWTTQTIGYYNVANELLAAAGLPNPNAKLRVLNVPALMRNSMHSNGIHQGWKNTDTIEVIDGLEFRFEHGKPVHCGSWYHIVTALSAGFNIIDELLMSPPIRELVDVADSYSIQASPEDG